MNTDHKQHPPQDQLHAYGLGKLAADEANQIEKHLEECETCAETIVNLQDDTFIKLVRETPQGSAANSEQPQPQASAAKLTTPDATVALDAPLPISTGRLEDLPAELCEHPRYEVLELIGRGGMGDVYKAQHRVMDRVVALKVIKPEMVQNEEAVERFRREVQAAARLHHKNIVTAHDAEQAGGLHFLVMEYADGVDLDQFVRRRGALPVEQACECIRQAAEGLQYAHELGMVHRDIKPHNLMLTSTGEIKILDFGLANFASETVAEEQEQTTESEATTPTVVAPQLTRTGSMMGTPDFISPEQALDAHTADIRADIYSLGCTFYKLLTGKAPFDEGSVMEKIHAHSRQRAAPLAEFRDDVPPDVQAVLGKMMAKLANGRYQEPREIVEALAKKGHTALLPTPEVKPQPAPARRKPLVIAAVATMLISLILAGVIFYLQTNVGTVRVEVVDESLEVKLAGNQISMRDGEVPITIRPGKQSLVVTRGDFEFETDTFDLRRGDDLVLKVELISGQIIVRNENKVIDYQRLPRELALNHTVSHDWKPLFNGKDLTGWKTTTDYPNNWIVKDGLLTTTGATSARLFSERGDYENFHLKTEVRLSETGNSGVYFRSEFGYGFDLERVGGSPTTKAPLGLEADLVAVPGHTSGGWGPAGTVFRLGETENDKFLATSHEVEPDTWFTFELIADSRQVTVKINGKLVNRFEADGAFTAGGHIALAATRGRVEFRKIEISELSSSEARSPNFSSLQVLSELGPNARFASPSPDGLTIYYEADGNIWQASRPTLAAPFGNKRPLLKGAKPAISGDGLELVFIRTSAEKGLIFQTSRASIDAEFDKPREILTEVESVYYPWLNHDGRALLYMRPGKPEIYVASRPNRISSWSNVQTLATKSNEFEDRFTGPSLTNDGMHLFNALKGSEHTAGNLYVWHRGNRSEAFEANQLIDIPGLPPLIGDYPRHVPQSNELYFTRMLDQGKSEVVVVRNFTLPKITQQAKVMQEVRRFEGHQRAVKAVAFSPNGKYIASASGWPSSDNTARIWDRQTGKQLHLLSDHSTRVVAVAFSPDGTLLLSGDDRGRIIFWNPDTGEKLRECTTTGFVENAVFTPDGKKIVVATGSSGKVEVLDPATAESVKQYPFHQKVNRVAVTPDGSMFAVALKDGTAGLYKLADGTVVRKYEAANIPTTTLREAYVVAISPDGTKLAAGYKAHTVRVWELATGKVLRDIRTANSGNEHMAFLADSRHLAVSGPNNGVSLRDSIACVVDTQTGEVVAETPTVLGHGWAFALSTDDRYMLTGGGMYYDGGWKASGNYGIRMWELPESVTSPGSSSQEAPSAGNSSAAAAESDAPQPASDIELLGKVGGHRSKVEAIAVSSQGLVATTDDSGRLAMWDTNPLNSRSRWVAHQAAIWDAQFTPAGDQVVTVGNDHVLRVWDPQTSKQLNHVNLFEIEGNENITPRAVSIAADGQLAAVGGFGTDNILICDLVSGKVVQTFDNSKTLSLFFLDQGRKLLTTNREVIRLINVEHGTDDWTIKLSNPYAVELAVSPAEELVALGSRKGQLEVYRMADGSMVRKLLGHTATVGCLEFTADGKHLVTGSDDMTIRLWNVATGKEVARGVGPSHCFNRLAILPDGKTVLSGGGGYYDDAAQKYTNDRDYGLYQWQLPESAWPEATSAEVDDRQEANAQQSSTVQAARKSVSTWLKHADAGEFAKCAELSSTPEKKISAEDIRKVVVRSREGMGTLVNRSEQRQETSVAMGMRLMKFYFRSDFEQEKNITEVVIAGQLAEDQWQVGAYTVKNKPAAGSEKSPGE